MRDLIFAEDVDNVIQSYVMGNFDNERVVDTLIAAGSELLDISVDEMRKRIEI